MFYATLYCINSKRASTMLSSSVQADKPDTELSLSCSEFRLLPGDYVGVHGPGRYSQVSGTERPPHLITRDHILVELITEEAGGGRLRCSVQARPIGYVGLNHRLCGITNRDVRIVGGEEAPKNAYPWLVRNGIWCAAGVPQHVITINSCEYALNQTGDLMPLKANLL